MSYPRGGGGGGTSNAFTSMKSKRCSGNFQSIKADHRGNSQRFCKIQLGRLINIRRFPCQRKLALDPWRHQRKRRKEKRIYTDRTQV